MSLASLAAILIGLWENPWPIGLGVFLTGFSLIFVIGLNWHHHWCGAGRGVALMFILLGLLVIGIVFFSWLKPSVRKLEDQLPDVELEKPESEQVSITR